MKLDWKPLFLDLPESLYLISGFATIAAVQTTAEYFQLNLVLNCDMKDIQTSTNPLTEDMFDKTLQFSFLANKLCKAIIFIELF